MKILVCGGRDFCARAHLFQVLDDLHYGTGPDGGPGGTQRLITCVVHGAARGADLLAEEWAKARQIPYRGYPARWKYDGRSAGPIRNAWMLHVENKLGPDQIGLVVAFPGAVGTADMVRKAKAAAIKVLEVAR